MKIAIILIAILLQAGFATYTPITDQPNCLTDNLTADGKCTMTKATRAVNGTNTSTVGLRVYQSNAAGVAQEADLSFSGVAQTYNYYSLENTNESGQAPSDSCGNSEPMVRNCNVYDNYGICMQCSCGFGLLMSDEGLWTCIENEQRTPYCHKYNSNLDCIECKWTIDNPNFANIKSSDFTGALSYDYGLVNPNSIPGQNFCVNNVVGTTNYDEQLNRVYLTTGTTGQSGLTPKCKYYTAAKDGNTLKFKCITCHTREFDLEGNNRLFTTSTPQSSLFPWVSSDYILSYVKDATIEYTCKNHPINFVTKPSSLVTVGLLTGRNVDPTTSVCTTTEDNETDNRPIEDCGLSVCTNPARTVKFYGCAEKKDCQTYTTFEWDYDTFQSTRTWWRKIKDGSCNKPGDHCTKLNGSQCVTCDAGFFPVEGKSECLAITGRNTDIDDNCSQGYYLYNTSTSAPKPDAYKCQVCASGYYRLHLSSDMANTGTNDFDSGSIVCKQQTKSIDFDDYTGYVNTLTKINTQGCMERTYKKDASNNEIYNCYTQDQNLFYSGFNSTDTGSCRDGNLMNQSRRLCKVGKEQLVTQMIPNCETYSVYQYAKQQYRCYQCAANCWLNTINSKCYCPLKSEKIKNCDLYYQGECMKCKSIDDTNTNNYYLVYSDKCISYGTEVATLTKYANCLRISGVNFPGCVSSGITPGQCVECEIGFILNTSAAAIQFCTKDTARYAQYSLLNKQELVDGTDTYSQYIDQSCGLLKCDKLVGSRTPTYYFDIENHQPYKKQYCIRTPATDNCLQYRTDAQEDTTVSNAGYGQTQYQSAFLTSFGAKYERCILCKDGYYLSTDGQSCAKPTVSISYVGKNQYGERVAVKTQIDGCITYSDQGDYCLRCGQDINGNQQLVKLNGSTTQCIVSTDASCDTTKSLFLQFADWRYYVSGTSYPQSEFGQLCIATAAKDANCASNIYSLYRTGASNTLALRCADCNNIANTSATLKITYYITADTSFDGTAAIYNKCILTFDPAREGNQLVLNLNYQGLVLQTYAQFEANNLLRLLYAQQLVQSTTDPIPQFFVQDSTNKKDHYYDYWNLQQSQCIATRISLTTGATRNNLSYYSKSYQQTVTGDHLMNKGCALADNLDNGLGCTKCNTDSIMSETGVCILKTSAATITNCGWYQKSTTNVCIKCKDGFVFDATNACVATNCATVKPQSYNKCNVCNDGYYKTTAEVCTVCLNNCNTCSSDTTCLTCNAGYTKTATNTCIQCNPTNCTTCSTTANTCTACKNGYYVNAGACTGCDAKCETCNGTGNTNCQTCATNSFLTGTTCEQCDANCINCTSGTVCGTCKTGYSYIGGTCTQCTKANCKECSAAATCTNCNSGFFVATAACSTCGAGCDTCTSNTVCTACLTGNFLAGGACTTCDTKCSACTTNATTCSACKAGNYLSGSTCTACTAGCAICTAADTCQKCSSNTYNLIGNSCVKCSNNCATCTSSTSCTTCSATYYLKSGACTQDCGTGFIQNIKGTCVSSTINITYSPTVSQCYATPTITDCIDYDVTNKTCRQCAAGYLLKTKEVRDATTGVSTFTYTCVFSADFNFIQSIQAITTYCIYQTYIGAITTTSTGKCARYHLPDIVTNDAGNTVTYNNDIAAFGNLSTTVQCVYPFYLSGSTCVLNDSHCLIYGSTCSNTFTFNPSEYLCGTYRTNKHTYSNTLQTLSCKTPQSSSGNYFQVIKQTEYTAGEGDTQVTYIGDGPFQGCTRFKRSIGKKDVNSNVIYYNWDCCGCDNKRHYASESDNKLEFCSIGTQFNCGVYEDSKDACKNCCSTNSIIFNLDSGICSNYCNIGTIDATKIYNYQDQANPKGDACTVTGCVTNYYFDTDAKTCTIKDVFLYNGQQTIIGCNYQNTNFDQTYFQNKNACVKRDQKCDCYDNLENSLDLYYTNKSGTNYCRRPYNYAAEEDQCLKCNVGYKYENGTCTKRDANNHCAFWGEGGQCEVCDFVQTDSNQIPDRQNEYRLTQDGSCIRNKEPNDLFKGCRKSTINGDVEVCIQCYNYDVTYPYMNIQNIIEPSTLDSRGHSRKFCMFKSDNTYLATRAYSTGATGFGFDPQWCMVGYQTYNQFSNADIMDDRYCSLCYSTTNNMKDTYYYSNVNKEKVYTAYEDASQIENQYTFTFNQNTIDDKRIYYTTSSQCAVEALGGATYNVKYCRRYSRSSSTVCTECHPGYHSDYVRYPGLDNNLSGTSSGTKCIPDDYSCAQTGCKNYKNLRKFEFNKCDFCYQSVETLNKDNTKSESLYSINSYSFVCDNIGGGVIEQDTPKLYSFTGKDGGVLTFYDPGDDGDNDFKEKFVDDLTVFGSQLYFSMALLCILALFVLV